MKPLVIRKIAVLGAGVMGAQIAAHCVNANIPTLLFDLPAKDNNRNALVDKAIANLVKLKPSPLATPQTASLLQAKNYEDNLPELRTCDLVIEAIAERLDWKEALYKQVVPYLHEKAILVSNTSGLSINALSDVLPETFLNRFCGVHFFNPPRYMHLAELIPAKRTSPQLIEQMETWLTSRLGKGVVVAKDTPNFIANRIGVFSLLATLHHADIMNIGLDEVDALTGTLLGRPKSATCRTMDVVGLDTMQHVVHTMKQQLKEDPWHQYFKLPKWLQTLIEEGHLGQKSGQGIYRKQGKTIEVLDVSTGKFRTAAAAVSAELTKIMCEPDPKRRMQALLASDDRQAKFLTACYRDLFHYCAYHLADIATSVRDVDLAMRWGFGWQQGPFETWQHIGVNLMRDAINASMAAGASLSTAPLPSWLTADKLFYTEKGAFAPANDHYLCESQLPVYQRQYFRKGPFNNDESLPVIFENEGVRLAHFKGDIALLSFKSKANCIGNAVLDGMQEAITNAEQRCQGVLIYQQDELNFSAGANLREVASLIAASKMNALNAMIEAFQQTVMRIKYSSIPFVAALRGRALGGGCELLMHCDAIAAAFESYPGLVEVGVGLLPAGGGCKEMAMRVAIKAEDADLMRFIQPAFQQIATASVAESAPDALRRGYLRPRDCWVMHSNEVLYVALAKIHDLLAANYSPPLPQRFKVAGRAGHAQLKAGLVNWLEGGFISAHDYVIANEIAHVICGGDVNQGELVDEAWILNLEKQSFMALAAMPLSQARLKSLLETGKPLRN